MTVRDADGKNIRIGCQSWGYDDWITPAGGENIFYPTGTKRGEMLPFYSKVFDTIEVDSTLYGIPASSTLEKWYDETPPDFVFSLKFPREITHDGRLSPATVKVMLEFVERVQLLKEKLGVLLIQFPQSFEGSRENGQRLREFLPRLPRNLKFAIEFRNQDWLIDWTFQELGRNDATLALVEGPWLPRELMFDSIGRSDARFAYIRIMGERDLDRFDRIYRYRDETLEKWAEAIARIEADDIFIYIDNHFEGFAPETAARMQRLLGLPMATAENFQRQRSLFS
jgi:uncharacterized protein YecE (DUF72 family)